MTARLRLTWEPGRPLPKRANRLTIQKIIEHEIGATIGLRYVDLLGVTPVRVGGQNVYAVDRVLAAAKKKN